LTDRIDIEISPDGQHIVLPRVLGKDGLPQMVSRDLRSLESVEIPGVAGVSQRISASAPRISPDGRWLAFRVNTTLRKVPLEGGTPTTISEECSNVAAWLDDASLVCTTKGWGLGRVSSAGGPVEVLALPDTSAGEIALWSASVLPNGKAVLFTSYRRPKTRIEVLDLESRKRHVLVENAVRAQYARSGHLLFVRDNALFAIRFDPKALRTSGSAVPVLEDVATKPSDTDAGFAISDNGTLAVVRQSEWAVRSRLVWVDRHGAEQPAITTPGDYSAPRLSPDRTRVMLTAATAGHRDLWLYDLQRALLSQLTRSPASSFGGVWTPDGKRVLFTNETPSYDVYQMPIDGSSAPAAIISNVKDKYPGAVSPDGAHFVFTDEWAGGMRLMVAPLDGRSPPTAISDSSVRSFDASLSSDGKWIAYTEATASGGSGIFVRRADGTGAKLQVTSGAEPDGYARWTKGGREVVFRRQTAVFAAQVDVATGKLGTPVKLFDGPYPQGLGYDVTSDGERFLMVRVDPRPEALPILVITNFFDELRRKVGS
jgi:Tol biopolymer transport system component